MNERIKELEQQCWSHRVDGTLVDGQLHFDTQKFAELIIRECISVVDDAERGGSNEIWDNAVKFVRKDIKEHFGVERERTN
jgi:hypothetical protein